MKLMLAVVLFALSLPAASEVLHLDCATENPLADNRVYIIDTSTGAAFSTRYDYGFMLPAQQDFSGRGFYSLLASGGGCPRPISRVTGKYRTKFEDEADTGCVLLEDTNQVLARSEPMLHTGATTWPAMSLNTAFRMSCFWNFEPRLGAEAGGGVTFR